MTKLVSRTAHVITAIALAATGLLATAAPAVAQEFVKVDDAAREEIPAVPFVAIAYGFIWAAVLVYVLLVARRIRRVEADLRDVEGRLERAGHDVGSSSDRR